MYKAMKARRRKSGLLTTVSALAITLSAYPAMAEEPSTWIQLGWQSDHVYNSHDSFALPLGSMVIPIGLPSPLTDSLSLMHSYGEFGKITYRPENTNWVFSASIAYGRSGGKRRGVIDHSQTVPTNAFVTYHASIPAHPGLYSTTRTQSARISTELVHVETVSSESHHMIDFEAGHDVGLGLFGEHGTSMAGIGVRFAQLRSSLNIANFRAVADVHLEHHESTASQYIFYGSNLELATFHRSGNTQNWFAPAGNAKSAHNFAGYGPTVHWDASASLWGAAERGGEVSVDWGVNGAILFGKQKNKAQHQTIGRHYCYGHFCPAQPAAVYQNTSSTRSEKRVTVPNLGGFMGVSYRFEDIKLSAGYRGDFFFRAIDTGTGQSITRGFQGPYASISIGVGD